MKRSIHLALVSLVCGAAVAPAGAQLTQMELSLWNSEKFRTQFAQSYIAETEIEPTLDKDDREDMMEVMELVAADDMDGARVLLEKIRSETSSAVFDFTLANIYFQNERLDDAAFLYQIAVDKYPKFRRAWRNLGLILVRQGEYKAALPALTQVIELGGGDALTYGLIGFAYSNVENSLAAESAYRMAILLDPTTMDWKMGLARSLFRQQRYADAAALLDTLIRDQPNKPDLWLLQANAYIGLEQPMRAAENYEVVDQLGGSTVDSLNMLADIYVNQELNDVAVDTYVRALEMDKSGNFDRAVRAAKVMTTNGALEETKTLVDYLDSRFGAQLDPEDRKDLLKLRARVAVAEGAGDEEARVLEEIVEIDPLDGEALILLGRHAGRSGDIETAEHYYERAAAIEQFEADAKVRHAQLLVRESRYEEALPLLRRAQMLKPRDNVQKYLEQVEQIARRGS